MSASRQSFYPFARGGCLVSIALGFIGAILATRLVRQVGIHEILYETPLLTGWTQEDAVGNPLSTIFKIVNKATRLPTENPATRALRGVVVVGLTNHTVLVAKDGTERLIDNSAAPNVDAAGKVTGITPVASERALATLYNPSGARHVHGRDPEGAMDRSRNTL